MNSFKEQLQSDIQNIFLNLNEYGEHHIIEGREIVCVITDDTSKEGSSSLGMAEADLVVYAMPKDLPARKSPGASLNVDGREYIVTDWSVDAGIAQVTLQQNRSV